jgi:hypothetical protein
LPSFTTPLNISAGTSSKVSGAASILTWMSPSFACIRCSGLPSSCHFLRVILYHILLLPHSPFLRKVLVGVLHLISDTSRNPSSNIDSMSCSKSRILMPAHRNSSPCFRLRLVV